MIKKFCITLVLAAATMVSAQAQDKFTKTMEGILATMDTAKTQGTYLKLANKLDRIALAEKDKWLPYYWSAQTYIILSYMEEDGPKTDGLLDKAEGLIGSAEKLKGADMSEIYVVQGWIHSARIGVNPMVRGMKYGPLSDQMQEKAKEANPDNPRPWYMLGTGKFYTPPMFGGGKDKAEPLLETALEKYKIFKPKSSIHPDWGQKETEAMLKQCKEEE